jgi:hypothetical protein
MKAMRMKTVKNRMKSMKKEQLGRLTRTLKRYLMKSTLMIRLETLRETWIKEN